MIVVMMCVAVPLCPMHVDVGARAMPRDWRRVRVGHRRQLTGEVSHHQQEAHAASHQGHVLEIP
jgi:hypothetical protein